MSKLKIAALVILPMLTTSLLPLQGRAGDGATAASPVWETLQAGLSTLFRSQRRDGTFVPSREDSLLEEYPLFATFSLHAYRHTGDKGFASRARSAITGYYDLLFTRRDEDRDLLVEGPSKDGKGYGLEDPGFNAVVSLDLLALSELCLELGVSNEALFWRMQANSIARRIAESLYDVEGRFFFPKDERSGKWLRYYRCSAFLPLLFTDLAGSNIARAAIREYLLKGGYLFPENPADYLSGAAVESSKDPAALLKGMMLLEVLQRNGFDERDSRDAIAGRIESHTGTASPYVAAMRTVLLERKPLFFLSPTGAVDLLCRLVYEKRAFEDPRIIEIMENAEVLRGFLSERTDYAADDRSGVQEAVKELFFTASAVRRQLEDRSRASPWAEESIFGPDFRRAVSELIDEAVLEFRDAENLLYESQADSLGLEIILRVRSERIVLGEPVPLEIRVLSAKKPLKIRSVRLLSDDRMIELFDDKRGVTILPGDSILSFDYRTRLATTRERALNVLRASVVVETGSGRRIARHFTSGVFVDMPVYYRVGYPGGRLLGDTVLPIEISIEKKTARDTAILVAFYSPSGLLTEEGGRISLHMPADAETTSVLFHVSPPRPCRPGAFPFVVKLFADAREMGVVESRLFKHYQWTFLGPFRPGSPAATIGSKKSINLFERFRDGDRVLYWRELPAQAYGPAGTVLLDGLVGEGASGYLYTIVSSPTRQECHAFLASNVQSRLILNGRPVVSARENSPEAPSVARVRLREGLNDILIEVSGTRSPWVYFQLGDEDELTPDEFNNNLWEIVEGYDDFHRRSEEKFGEKSKPSRIVTLTYEDPAANSVAVIGSFNGWSPDHYGMKRIAPGKWRISLNLPPGKYAYRFLVDNRRLVLDPSCPFQESDGYGGKNSVLYVE